jgi:hypothetical protein
VNVPLDIKQQINIDIKQNTSTKRKFLYGTRANKLNDLLALEDWSSVYALNSTDSKFEMFNTLLVKYIDQIIPVLAYKSGSSKVVNANDITKTALTEQVKLFEALLIQNPCNSVYKDIATSKTKLKNYISYKNHKNNTKEITESDK